jgi:hypothetical protein
MMQNAVRRSFPHKEKSMKIRVILVCTVLLLAAVPSFALPLCGHCNEWNFCESAPGDFERCLDGLDYCVITTARCSIPRSPETTVLADWSVASIEISQPALSSVTATAPAAVAEAPMPSPQTTDLK